MHNSKAQPTAELQVFIYAIYDHPTDYPNDFVVRRWNIKTGEPEQELYMNRDNADDIRVQLQRIGLVNIGRTAGDDPKILECWI